MDVLLETETNGIEERYRVAYESIHVTGPWKGSIVTIVESQSVKPSIQMAT